MNKVILNTLKVALASACLWATSGLSSLEAQTTRKEWKLVWSEEFNDDEIDYSLWSKIPRGNPQWRDMMSNDERLYAISDGKLILTGMVNDGQTGDKTAYLTGGLWTRGRKAFKGGKIEVRAKLQAGKGAWPAIWLMPYSMEKKWPMEGEIDIMERLNYDKHVYQTVHSNWTWNLKRKAGSTHTTPIRTDDFNTYGVEMREDKLIFYVNGAKTFEYVKLPERVKDGQFPFYREMHLILSMQLEGNWVGKVNPKDLPLEMEIDWCRHYVKENVAVSKASGMPWDDADHARARTNERIVQSLSLEGATHKGKATEFTTIVAGEDADYQDKVYFENTQDVLEATLGDRITLRPKVKNLSWMHYYLYIDYNQNGVFEQDEVVSYSAKHKNGKWQNSKGQTVSEETAPETLPTFTIPKTAKLGKTRVRFKVDWDSLDPKGNRKAKQLLSNNGGTICDFSINIHSDAETTALESLEASKELSVYPNPVQRVFKLKTREQLQSIKLYSLSGELVKKFNPELRSFDVTGLAKGNYLLVVQMQKGKQYQEVLTIQ